jgi:hypothetical protein
MRPSSGVCFLVVTMGSWLLPAGMVFAQTTGQVEGVVVDKDGAALPGVTVEATSQALQGARTVVTDEGGAFRLLFLPPGSYTVRCSLSGFSTVENEGIVVPLGRTVALHVEMQGAFSEAVEVRGAPPLIDVRSAEIGGNVSRELLLALPLDRDYAAAVQAVPGTTTDGSGPVVYGSTGVENAFIIDGVATNNTWTGGQGRALNFEFVQEMEVKTGGYQAEFGRATGGVINVITRSGGNELHGDAFGYYFSDALQSRPKREVEQFRLEHAGSYTVDGFRRSDLGFDLGGYLMKDTLWFFAAYDRVDNSEDDRVAKDFSPYGGPPLGTIYNVRDTRNLWAGKLTWRPGANHSLVVSGFGDPGQQRGNLAGRGFNGEESTFWGTEDGGGNDAVLHYQGVLGAHAILDARASRYTLRSVFGGAGVDLVQVVDSTTPLFAQTGVPAVRGGLGDYYKWLATRDEAKIDATFFLGHLAGEHEVKVGVERERDALAQWHYLSGGQVLEIRCAEGHLALEGCPQEWIYYYHTVELTGTPPGGVEDPSFASYVTNGSRSPALNVNDAAFLQDTWRLTPALTLDLGIRWSQQRIHDRHGAVALTLADEWAPRLGFVWDYRGDGRSKLYGSWGRFYETIPIALAAYSFNSLPWAATVNRDPEDVTCDPSLAGDPAYGGCMVVASSPSLVDPNGVRGGYLDEAVLGVEASATRDLVVGATLVYRRLGMVVGTSVDCSTGGYYAGNPGYGQFKTACALSGGWLVPVPKAKRTFKGVEVTALKRLSNNWQLTASYLWSKLEGNYDGGYTVDLDSPYPQISPVFDVAEFAVHTYGPLANDRRHQAKVDAAYFFPFGLTLGAAAAYRSGRPLSAIGYFYPYGLFGYSIAYLSQRGAWGRTDPEYEVSLHLGYPVRVGGVEINFLLDVFNLLNRQGETGRDQRYNFDQTVEIIDPATGAVLPPIAPGTPCASIVPPGSAITCNAGFNTSDAWQDPRSVRLGIRLTF